MTLAKPYSPATLADRWGCSSEKVRTLYRNGDIAGFQIGKLIRIPAAEVERYECQNTPSLGTVESSPSHGESLADGIHFASRLARLTGDSPKLAPVTSGNFATLRQANG